MNNPLDKILTEWAYRVHNGSPDPTDNYHVFQLEEYLNELRLPREVVKRVLEKVRKYVDNPMNRKLNRVGEPWGSEGTPPENKKDSEETQKSGKDKSLREDATPVEDFNNKDEFIKTGISDEEFENNPNVEKNSEQDFKFTPEQMKKFFGDPTKFPKRYIKALERLMSTKLTPGVSITDVMKGVGAGELQAQAGEILTMMGSTIKDPEVAKEFFNMLREHTKTTDTPIITESWINSAEKVRTGIHRRLDATYGEGEWEITSSGWDVKEEVESMGMKDYKKDKGFSTDAYFVINGEDMDEVSLKKDLNANLLNATTGRVLDLIIQGNASDEELEIYDEIMAKATTTGKFKPSVLTPEERQQIEDIQKKYATEEYGFNENVDVDKAKQRQRKLHNETLGNDNFLNDVKGDREITEEEAYEIGKSMAIRDRDAQSIAKTIKEDIPKILERIKHPVSREELAIVMKELGMKTNSRSVGKIAVIMMRIAHKKNPGSETANGLKKVIENSHGHSKAVAQSIIDSPEVRKGLLKSIREALPLGALLSGEEKMHLGDQALDQEVLSTIFGVSSMDELVAGLTVSKDGNAIVYQVDVENPDPPPETIKEDIPIATITNRPDGVAYGETWKLEFKVHKMFKKEIDNANKSLGRK